MIADCGHESPKSELWPSENGGTCCQVCWEGECAESFWRFVAAVWVGLEESQ